MSQQRGLVRWQSHKRNLVNYKFALIPRDWTKHYCESVLCYQWMMCCMKSANLGYFQRLISPLDTGMFNLTRNQVYWRHFRHVSDATAGWECLLGYLASEIFQKKLVQALDGLPGVVCITNDILIHSKDIEEHDWNLKGFLSCCRGHLSEQRQTFPQVGWSVIHGTHHN